MKKFVCLGKYVLAIAMAFTIVGAHADEEWGDKNAHPIRLKTEVDNYTQFFGPAMTGGLKLTGYEGRSDWPRLLASAAMSYGIMAGLTESLKHTVSEVRPDGTSADSWPSGHTAVSFVGATILHREYGMTRSPWFSMAGYGVATATGMLRVLNNRHWAGDVMAGAGIGIMSTEVAYALSDVFFRDKHLLRAHLETGSSSPSFVSVSMGLGFGSREICFADNDEMAVSFHTAAVADAEGAWFFNDYVGVGGRLRTRITSIRSLDHFMEIADKAANAPMNAYYLSVDDHLAEFTPSAGLYLNIPLDNRFSLGTKGLVGCSFIQKMDVNAHPQEAVNDESRATAWDFLTLDATNSVSLGTGLSVTYRYRPGYAWRLFLDYDITKKTYTMDTDLMPTLLESATYMKTQRMHYLTAGASFCINF